VEKQGKKLFKSMLRRIGKQSRESVEPVLEKKEGYGGEDLHCRKGRF